jgi:hypothetical protein
LNSTKWIALPVELSDRAFTGQFHREGGGMDAAILANARFSNRAIVGILTEAQ